jgi:Fe-Mn family superoxide dismutase
MKYEIKKFDNLSGLNGFSEQVIKNHLALYDGYINNVNKLDDILVAMEKENRFSTPEFAELNRRFGWEWNGMRLHELYFGNLIKGGIELKNDSELYKKIVEEWGSYEMFEKDFKSMGAMRGLGWVILYYDSEAERLFNVWINEHDTGHFSGAAPLLVMDVFEHAYMIDYGLKKTDYIEAFFKNINWSVVKDRFKNR